MNNLGPERLAHVSPFVYLGKLALCLYSSTYRSWHGSLNPKDLSHCFQNISKFKPNAWARLARHHVCAVGYKLLYNGCKLHSPPTYCFKTTSHVGLDGVCESISQLQSWEEPVTMHPTLAQNLYPVPEVLAAYLGSPRHGRGHACIIWRGTQWIMLCVYSVKWSPWWWDAIVHLDLGTHWDSSLSQKSTIKQTNRQTNK